VGRKRPAGWSAGLSEGSRSGYLFAGVRTVRSRNAVRSANAVRGVSGVRGVHGANTWEESAVKAGSCVFLEAGREVAVSVER
jgi:hypothetical protein